MAAAPALEPPRLLWVVEERDGTFRVVLEDAHAAVDEGEGHSERFVDAEAAARYVRHVLERWRESRS